MYYETVLKTLHKMKVDYLIAGGIAVNLHGVPRYTKDLDILVDTSKKNLARLGKALEALGYRPRAPVSLSEFLDIKNWAKWKEEKGMRAFTLFNPKSPFEEIDILTDTPISFTAAKKQRLKVQAGRLRVNVVSIKHLMEMKRKASRQQDLSDIEALKVAQRVKRKL